SSARRGLPVPPPDASSAQRTPEVSDLGGYRELVPTYLICHTRRFLQVFAEELRSRLDCLRHVRFAVIQVDVLPGVQPDQFLRLVQPLVGLLGALRRAEPVDHAV